MGSKSDVSAFFRLRFRNGLGTKPALVLLFRMRVPNTFFLSLAWWLAGFFFVFSRFQKQRFGSFLAAVSHGLGTIFFFNGFQKRRFGIFPAAVSQWLGHKTCWGSAFSHARPKHLFLEFGLVACRLPSLMLRKGLPCLRQPFFFVFSRFQKQRFGIFLVSAFFVGSKSNVSAVFWLRLRIYFGHYFFLFNGFQKRRFGIFPAAVSQWLGHKTCWGSAFSHARPKHLFLEFGLVACRLPSLTLRMRVPNTFFLSLAWWLAGFQVLRCAKV